MLIQLKKFGTTLVSRPSGKEAYLAYQSTLKHVGDSETIEVDFEGVAVLTPSWADEFLTPMFKDYKNNIKLTNTQNSSVKESLKMLDLDRN